MKVDHFTIEQVTLVGLFVFASLGAATSASRADVMRPVPSSFAGAFASGITVSGHAEMKVKPDVARVTLSVSTQSREQADAVHANAAKMTAVMQALTKSNIASADIRTAEYSVQPNYDYNNNGSPPVLTGFTVTNSVDVTIRDLPKAGLILDKAVEAGATAADGLSFDLSDKNKVQGEALVAAVANGRSKADLIAGASGVSLGRILSVTEQGAAQQVVQPMFRMAMAAAATPTTPISPQEITITADVTETFAIDYSGQ